MLWEVELVSRQILFRKGLLNFFGAIKTLSSILRMIVTAMIQPHMFICFFHVVKCTEDYRKMSKKIAVYAFAISAIVALLMSTFITTITFAQMGDEIPVPHYFGPYPNYATSQLPTVDPDTGAVSGGIRKFIDSLPGLGPAGANNLGQYISVAVPDTTTYPE